MKNSRIQEIAEQVYAGVYGPAPVDENGTARELVVEEIYRLYDTAELYLLHDFTLADVPALVAEQKTYRGIIDPAPDHEITVTTYWQNKGDTRWSVFPSCTLEHAEQYGADYVAVVKHGATSIDITYEHCLNPGRLVVVVNR